MRSVQDNLFRMPINLLKSEGEVLTRSVMKSTNLVALARSVCMGWRINSRM